MSTYTDWAEARERRDEAAYQIAKAYMAGTLATNGASLGYFFEVAEADMKRIERELDGRAGK